VKIICVGDIHGKTVWRDVLAKEQDADKVIFLGDYFDCFEPVSTRTQIENFNAIVELKRNDPNKYILLIGNHDYHYMKGFADRQGYSGYQYRTWQDIQDAVEIALPLMQICHVQDKFCFTHAGVTNTWAWVWKEVDKQNLETSINQLWLDNIKYEDPFRFNRADYSGNGSHKCQGPLWVRPKQLSEDMVQGYVHVIGHTQIMNYTVDVIKEYLNKDIVLCDTFDSPIEPMDGLRHTYYNVIVDGVIEQREVKWHWDIMPKPLSGMYS
jgi:predicted phosphodiesterase